MSEDNQKNRLPLSSDETTAAGETARRLLEEKDADARTRSYNGFFGILLTVLLTFWAVFQIYVNTIGVMSSMDLRMWHCMFLLVFTFLLYPTVKKEKKVRNAPPVWDVLLIALAIGAFGYMLLNYSRIAQSGGYLTKREIVIAALAMLVVFEAARRACPSLAVLGLIFLAYNFFGKYIPGPLGHTGFSMKRVLSHMVWGSQGIFGVGIGVSATYIFLFVLFGSFLKYSGFSKFINDLSLTLVGRSP